MQHRAYSYASQDEFLEDVARLKHAVPYSRDIAPLGESIDIGGKTVKNRLLAQPIEGFDSSGNGAPSDRSIERYRNLANGGSGTIWMESISVNGQGRSCSRQMWINGETVKAFQALNDVIRQNGAPFVVAQLTHSGRYSNPDGKNLAICAVDNPMIPRENSHIITDDEIEQLKTDYVNSAILAQNAGFDAIDIRACHGYLLNELLSAYERPGMYGGGYENRTRLLKDIVRLVCEKVAIPVFVRLNVMDGLKYPYGWGTDMNDPLKQDISEPLKLAAELYALGVCVLNVSSGIGAVTPFMIRPYDRGGVVPPEHPLQGVERLLNSARTIKAEVPGLLVVASGFTWLRDYAPMVAAGGIKDGWFDFAGFGRQWIADADYANEILELGRIKKHCRTCGGCTALIKSGKEMRCVFADIVSR
ncbi:MAG: NADH:flavin oxidoreductase [Clostridia bacterium]|nr:NADH:flavin oxidoreductase [Clostridia bacterium]